MAKHGKTLDRRQLLASLAAMGIHLWSGTSSKAWGQSSGMAGGQAHEQKRRPASGLPYAHFTDVAHEAGLTQPQLYGAENHVRYIVESMGGGCAFLDFDNDGWMDIFLVGGTRLGATPPGAGSRLYRNNRNGTFTDVTHAAGLGEAGWATGVCVADYNNDGFDDLFCTFYGQNRLYKNNGNGTFTDVTQAAGLTAPRHRFGTGCCFFDYNRDGHLDLFVANYVEFDLAHPPEPSPTDPTCTFEGILVYCGPRGLPPGQHSLYRNNGDGTFTDVSVSSGISKYKGSYGMTAVSGDFDADGWPDLFLACDSTPSLLLMNNHDGTFREEAFDRGVAVSGDGFEQAGMGVGVGDVSLAGTESLLVTHFQLQSTGLYLNDGKANFTDITTESQLAVETRFVGWGAAIADLDNNGLPDLLWVTGNVYPELEKRFPQYPLKGPRILFRNLGNGTFEELTGEAGPALLTPHASRGMALGDFDNDGDLDVLIMNVNEPPSLWRNDAPHENGWIKLKLTGTKSNRSAIGARVLVHYAGHTQMQEVRSQTSYLSCNDPRLHFGLGLATTADVEIFWPSGLHQKLGTVSRNQYLEVQEGKNASIKPLRASAPAASRS